MASYETFYPDEGHVYTFQKPYGNFMGAKGYHASVKDIGYPTDPLTANQLKKVSDKINTGTKTIEVSGLGLTGGGPMKHLASIPRQHWKEIDRLRKLTGVDLTFHGPLVESTGFSRGNWSEDQRVDAEKQMMAAVELAQQMNSDDKKKGIVMTFHSNNGLPEVERKVIVKRNPDGSIPEGGEKIIQMAVYNQRTGQIGNLPALSKDYYEGGEPDIVKNLDKFNEEQWRRQLENIHVNNSRVNRELIDALTSAKEDDEKIRAGSNSQNALFDFYKKYEKDHDNYKKGINEIAKADPKFASYIHNGVNSLQNANFFVNESYSQLKEVFNEAYGYAESQKNNKVLDKLNKYSSELKDEMKKYNETKNFLELQDKISQGINLLKTDEIKPKIYTPLRDFAVDKSSETFSNVALHAWHNAKKHNLSPGIISIENPPAGMSGLTRAEEIKELIVKTREKFVNKAVEKKIMSKAEATKVADNIIGATWDVGHINSIQKWGYNRKDVVEQAKTIAPYVKHMHIADNLGFEDAELPIGMGNVPIDKILDPNQAWTENFRKAKKTIETGDWFSRQGGLGMTKTPVTESLSGLSAPVYSEGSMGDAGMAYWNEAVNQYGGYFGGLGPINPEVHHSIYGGGFSGLPAYLGGEIPGKSTNSSFSGAPLD